MGVKRGRSGPICVRIMSRADGCVVFGRSFVRWKMIEMGGDFAEGFLKKSVESGELAGLNLVAERDHQIVGWLCAARVKLAGDASVFRRAWWVPEQAGCWQNGAELVEDLQGDILLGRGGGVLASVGRADGSGEYERIVASMYGFGRSQVVQKLGLRRWVARIPVEERTGWRASYSLAGYVQQVEAGAVDDGLLSVHLRGGARVLEIGEDSGQGWVWVVWDNPV